jgi:hypothetical protein
MPRTALAPPRLFAQMETAMRLDTIFGRIVMPGITRHG